VSDVLPITDGLGPAHNPFYRVDRSGEGVQAYPVAPLPALLTGPWQGRWIWVDPVRFPDS